MTLTCLYTTPLTKVRSDFETLSTMSHVLSEYKNDSQIIPRSSSVIVKRRPAVRPGKGKAAMYISGGPTGSSSTSASDKPSASVNLTNNTWHRPGLAPVNQFKRSDPKEREDQSDKLSQVRATSSQSVKIYNRKQNTGKSAATQSDEAAAMAAMFQAQTANWEETQEKMSQLVFPAYAGFLFRSRSVYLMNVVFFLRQSSQCHPHLHKYARNWFQPWWQTCATPAAPASTTRSTITT